MSIDHESTGEIVCPYCGNEYSDSYEYGDHGSTDCEECGKWFSFSRHVSVDYTTEETPCANGEGFHDWRSQAQEIGGKVFWPHKYRCPKCEKVHVFDNETRGRFESTDEGKMDKKTLELIGPPPFRAGNGMVWDANGESVYVGFISRSLMSKTYFPATIKAEIEDDIAHLLADTLNREAGVK